MTRLLFWLSFALATPSFAAPPQRIATCFVAADEVVIDLLEATGGTSRLVAVSTLAEDPRYSFAAPVPATVKHRCGAELESLLAARPDLVILASFNKPELIDRLRDAKVKVHVLKSFNTLSDVTANIYDIGKLLGAEAAALELEKPVKEFIPKHDPTNGPTLLSLSSDGVVAAGGTLFDSVVRGAGGVNLAAKQGLTGWPRLSAEAIARLDPDWLVASGDPSDPQAIEKALAVARGASGYARMRAVKERQIIVVPERELSAASHHIAKFAERLRAAFKK